MGARLLGCAAAAVALVPAAALLAQARGAPPAPPAASNARAVAAYDALPIRFEPNRGQGAANVRYLSRGPGYDLSLAPDGAVLALTGSATDAKKPVSTNVRLGLIGTDRHAQMSAASRLAGVSNYLAGPDSGDSHTGVPGFAQVKYHAVYPGIDLVFHGKRRRLEYDFVVAPGRDPSLIQLSLRGGRLSLSASGDLLLKTPAGTLRQPRPVAYQRIGGARRLVSSRYVLMGEGRVRFGLGAYDRSRPLVIDPELVYSGYPGEIARGVAADSAGNAYLAGEAGRVTKLSPSGALVYSTQITGASFTDVAVGSGGRAFLTGNASAGFPASASAFSQAPTGAIVAVLNAQGSSLDYASTLPGAGSSGIFDQNGIAVDSADHAYITGSTPSDLLPARAPGGAAFQAARLGGLHDAFVAKFDPSAAGDGSLVYATYLGGAGDDIAQRIAVDSAGGAYVTGQTRSQDFPTQDAYQSANAGGADAFVTKLDPQGSALEYSTYLGGTGDENERVPPLILSLLSAVMHIAVDGSGNAYVSGNTPTGDFPTKNALQSASGGDRDGFVAKLDPSLAGGPSLVYSTYLGGSGADSAQGVGVDAQNGAQVAGFTQSLDFPTASPLAPRATSGALFSGSGDVFVSRIEPDGSDLSFSSYLGGGGADSVNDLAVDASGNTYLVGRSSSFDLPTSDGLPSASEFAVKIARGDPQAPLVTALSNRSAPNEGGTTVIISGSGFGGASAVSFGGVPAESFTVGSATQITAVAPAHATGPAPVVVTAAGKSSPPRNPIATVTYGDGAFSPGGQLSKPRSSPTAALLHDGRVLVDGGRDAVGNALSSSELVDPANGTSTPTGPHGAAGSWSSLTVLANSRVLATGGSPAETFNPATGNWTAKPSPLPIGAGASATLLQNGKVLVAGGDGPTGFGVRAQLYDPAGGTWSSTAPMTTSRSGHGAALLAGPECTGASPPGYCGKVLVMAGGTDSSELYDPVSGTWDATGDLGVDRGAVDAVALLDGRVLVAFGGNRSAETYDPATGTWTPTGIPRLNRRSAAATLLPSGRVLFAGGVARTLEGTSAALNSAEVYDPTLPAGTPRFSSGLMTRYRDGAFAVALSATTGCGSSCGKVLIGGGLQAGRDIELYTPARPRATTPMMPTDPPSGPSDPVPPGGGEPPAAAVPGAGRDTVRPSLSALSVTDRSFSIGSLLPQLARASRVGTTISFRLSEPATVRLSFARARPGRRVGRSCRAPSPRLRTRRSCTRYVAVRPAVVVRGARAGVNSVRFQGRLSRTRRLQTGRYEVAVTATDAAGNRSAPRTTRFRLLSGRGPAR